LPSSGAHLKAQYVSFTTRGRLFKTITKAYLEAFTSTADGTQSQAEIMFTGELMYFMFINVTVKQSETRAVE